jgi:hypothetical protein
MPMKQWFSRNVVSTFLSAVLLANLLMPAIAGATVKRDQFSALFSVICTSSGIKLVDSSGNQSTPTHSLQDTVHCPLCVVSGSPVLPSTSLAFFGVFESQSTFTQISTCHKPIQALWLSASPRGPPAVS